VVRSRYIHPASRGGPHNLTRGVLPRGGRAGLTWLGDETRRDDGEGRKLQWSHKKRTGECQVSARATDVGIMLTPIASTARAGSQAAQQQQCNLA
jgi:hypothetical protein